MAFKMKGNPYKMGSMATKSAMKAKGGTGKEMTEAEKKAAMDNAMGAAEVAGRFDNNPELDKKMSLAKGEVGIVKGSRYATSKQRDAELARAQAKVDKLNEQGYFKAKARHASHVKK